ncbi:MAG: menaquinone reductase molybdopterin-binding-like subunit QrcB [Desulfococcaceae bacterium]|jgi:anaerobic selenocysteine-containing dehydrogenase|nr:menaquinone reductase molybdopterin-binding-like subunit QrcB [Desulfococcaceae bacterium]
MKIDRRSFLSLGVGAGAGIALSPLPWKLTDDLSIWTQMWPWTPVPKDGEIRYVNSVSTLCRCGCGIKVRKVDDRAVKIEGQEGYPGSDGSACALCMSGIQRLYSPTAIRMPLKNTGTKDAPLWQPVTWDTAIREISEKLGNLRKEGKPQALACISGSDKGTVPALFRRFLQAYGSPNFMSMPSYEDAYEMTLKLMHGTDSAVGFDLENADYVISFGSGILEGWGSSVRMFKAKSAWKDKKVKTVQVDTRLSNSAAKADLWLAVKPGSESLLALGMAAVIISEKLYDKKFADQYTFAFDSWKDAEGKEHRGFKEFILENYSLSYVARATGIEESQIVKIAKEFAGASAPIALCGRGQGNTPGSVHEFMAVHALNALAGNINQKGGVWAMPKDDYIRWDEAATDGIAKKGLETPRIDGAGTEKYPLSKSLPHRLAAIINAAEKSPVEVLLVSGANPVYSLPDSKAVKKAFGRIPFIVSFASHMDETSEMADMILPCPSHLERYEDVPTPAGMIRRVTGLARPVVRPQHNRKNAGDSLILIAKALGGSIAGAFPWAAYEECLEKTFGDKWKTLKETGYITEDFSPPYWDKAFATPSKKFAFMSEVCAGAEKKGGAGAAKPEGEENTFPLLLIPFDSMRLACGPVAPTPFMMKTVSDHMLKGKYTVVEIHPETAQKYGLKEGKNAVLSTPKGEAEVKVHLSRRTAPGIVAMPRGLGHSGPDEYISGKGSNFNELIAAVEDPVSGLDAAWGIRAKLVKA